MIRRVGERVSEGRRYVLRPGVYAILRRGDRVLLTHQAAPTPELQLPGGGIDPGEQPLAALHREVYEETGWSMRIDRRLGAFRRRAVVGRIVTVAGAVLGVAATLTLIDWTLIPAGM